MHSKTHHLGYQVGTRILQKKGWYTYHYSYGVILITYIPFPHCPLEYKSEQITPSLSNFTFIYIPFHNLSEKEKKEETEYGKV